MLKTHGMAGAKYRTAYHLGEVRVLKTAVPHLIELSIAYHLGEVRVLKTA